jgi:hypothetical protein
VSSLSDSDGMDSIPAIPNAQYVLLLLWHVRFNQVDLPKMQFHKESQYSPLHEPISNCNLKPYLHSHNGIIWYEKEITGHSIL